MAGVINSKDAREEWNGLVVHKSEWEARHPQDFVRGIKERIVPDGPLRPEVTGTTVDSENYIQYVADDYIVDQDDYVEINPA